MIIKYLSRGAGNMWAQSWMNIEPLVRPYPDKTSIDVTEEMQRQVRP
jgi:peptidyl-dipeptidase A